MPQRRRTTLVTPEELGVEGTLRTGAAVLEHLGVTAEELATLSEAERLYLQQCVDEILDGGSSPTAERLVEADYRWEPVSCEQFLADPYYLGGFTDDLFPKCRQALIEVFDGKIEPVECILGGGIGWGKTTVAGLGMVYDIYRIGCLRNPHEFYGLMPGSTIAFAMYSTSKEQAADSAFGKIVTWVETSPYFKERMPKVGKHTTKARFRDSPVMVLTGSQEVHAIGRDVYCFCLDEANFLTSKSSAQDETSRAYGIYSNAKNRLKSRFMDNEGKIPGKVWLLSSKRSHASFLEKHIAESKEDISTGKTRHYQFSQWEVRDPAKYTKPRFCVELGDRIYPSRILVAGESPRPGADIIYVPGEFREDFELNLDGAIRDIAGKATESVCPLIHDKRAIHECVDPLLVHPFSKEEVVISTGDDLQLSDLFLREVLFDVRLSRYAPRYEPEAPRFIHIDTAFTGDSLGLACCHVSGWKRVKRPRADGTTYEDKAPVVTYDFLLRVRPPRRGEEIELAKVRAFIINLRDMGLPIWRVTVDGHQSRDLVQIMRRLEFDAVVYSVDRTDEAYMSLKQATMERRVRYYAYSTYIRELSELERDIEERKVDHPRTSPSTGAPGSKDVSDAAAGALFNAMIDLAAAGAEVSTGDPVDNMNRRFRARQGDIAWDQLEREAK